MIFYRHMDEEGYDAYMDSCCSKCQLRIGDHYKGFEGMVCPRDVKPRYRDPRHASL